MTDTEAIERVLAEAERERQDLARKLEQVNVTIGFLRERLLQQKRAHTPSTGTVIVPGIASYRFKNKSAVEAAGIVLREHGKPMHINEIIDEVLKGGYSKQLDRKKMYYALYSSLQELAKKPQIFKKVAPATFGLIEWTSQAELGIK